MALHGEHEIPNFTIETMAELQKEMATAAQVQDASATLAALEPGTYTVFAFAIANVEAGSQADIEEMYASMLVASTIVTIEKEDERLSVTLEF